MQANQKIMKQWTLSDVVTLITIDNDMRLNTVCSSFGYTSQKQNFNEMRNNDIGNVYT
ncbi:hypothetical protein E2C01_090603 [Portunus trituberculatus]|uniref:Uncharacterized protein n=1 Tax=Portunus trituberculatus TaxID=210409 RepID=A0A5B7JSV3_PORTR|nr:hypothetical protein [Portunus trituberculatus]